MPTIIVTGTPGTGKTIIAKALATKYKLKYVDVNKVIQAKKLREKYDKKRKTWEVDTDKLSKELVRMIKEDPNVVIDSHLSHYVPSKYVDLCIVTKCNIKTLEKRLKKREYDKLKIRENLDAEIFDVCLTEAQEKKHKIQIIDTTKGTVQSLIRKVN